MREKRGKIILKIDRLGHSYLPKNDMMALESNTQVEHGFGY